MNRLSSYKSLPLASFLAALIVLIIGYTQSVRWLAAALLPLLSGLLAGMVIHFRWRWLPNALLVIFICAAAGGILIGAPAAGMILAATLFLASWELFKHAAYQQNQESERAHLRLLGIALGSGLVIAETGLLIHLSLPFAVVILAGALVIASLYRLYRVLNRHSA